jgi:MazG family protein
MRKRPAIVDLLRVMARLRSPTGCPWDREQDHRSLRWHAVEEVYELMDAIEAGDDREMEEELGDLLMQIVFHCQLARERGAFNFDNVAQHLTDKLIRRHPHVFGKTKVKTVDQVWANWDRIKRAEKAGTKHPRPSALDGIPRHLPSLLQAEKLVKKARKAGLLREDFGAARLPKAGELHGRSSRQAMAEHLFAQVELAQSCGWHAEDLLRSEIKKQERRLRRAEAKAARQEQKVK